MSDQSKAGEKMPPALTPSPWPSERIVKATALLKEIAANPPRTEEAVAEKVKELRALLPPSDETPPRPPNDLGPRITQFLEESLGEPPQEKPS